MEMGQRSEAGECGCEARTSRAELVGLVQLVRCLHAACALPLAAVGRCSRAGGEEKSVLDLPSGRPLFPFVCTFFFFFYIRVLHFPEAVILHKPLSEVHPFPLPKSPYQTLVTCR